MLHTHDRTIVLDQEISHFLTRNNAKLMATCEGKFCMYLIIIHFFINMLDYNVFLFCLDYTILIRQISVRRVGLLVYDP